MPDDEVASPTFAIVHAYRGRLPLAHADLYRLTDADDLYGTGYHELRDGPGRWRWNGWTAFAAAPPDALRIQFTEPGDGLRALHCRASGILSRHLLERWQDELLGRVG